MRYLIYFGLSLFGAVLFGFNALTLVPSVRWLPLVWVLTLAGGVFGALLACALYRHGGLAVRRFEGSFSRPVARREPVAFAERISRFTGSRTSEHSDPFVSRMSYWTRTESHVPTRPRSAELIRRLLQRIRALVRG